MAKLYICETRDGARALSVTTQADGTNGLIHLLDSGVGTIRGYSAQVNGTTVFYWVDNGPSLGEARSAT